MMVEVKEATTIRIDIFIAGDIAVAKNWLRSYCFAVGFCVHVEAVDYIYTCGEEEGVRVGIIHYPRFPADAEKLWVDANAIARGLMDALYQRSCSIVGPDKTLWLARKGTK